MIKLIFVRHGQTGSTAQGTYCGWTDVELNEEGIKEAYSVQRKLENFRIGSIFSSPLKRTRQTAEIINQPLSLPVKYVEDLQERNFGIWEDLSYDDISVKFPNELKQWEEDWENYCIDRGESAVQAYLRATRFVDDLIRDSRDGTFLIVTHLGCIRSMIAHLLGMEMEGSWRFRVNSGSITTITVNNEGYAYLTGLNI